MWRTAAADRLAFVVDAAGYFGALRDALSRARRSVFVLSWVIDSRVRLVRGAENDVQPAELADLLSNLVEEHPDLRVRVACWDHSVVFAFDRELLSRVRLGWLTPDRVRFELDGQHPPGAAHHEKVVVIDDRVAFIGGIDIGRYRWDTGAHETDHPQRVTPGGEAYPPLHDLQAVVSGDAARLLGEHARRRWQALTGEAVDAADSDDDPWPSGVAPDVEDVEIGIVRTRGARDGDAGVRETEALHLRMVEEAENHIYIENQYLTADSVGRALAGRLSQEDSPDVVAVTSRDSEGWLEQVTIDGLRARWCRELRDSDQHGRFAVYYPVNGDSEPVTVHSKLLVVDDRLLYLGSANLANRSMVLDTECGIAIDAAGRADVKDAIRGLRLRLLTEHLGAARSDIEAREAELGLRGAVEDLAGSGRTLLPLPTDDRELPDTLEPVIRLADPKQIPSLSRLARELFDGRTPPGDED